MKAQTENPAAKELFVKMALDAWEVQNSRVDKLLEEISDAQLQAETAPGKNSGVYVFGHLIAVSDGLRTIFGLGEKLYPQLEEVFLKNPENAGLEKPPVGELKDFWRAVNDNLRDSFKQLTADDWFDKHTAVSDEDFANEPHRNKLNVLLSRTNHQSYHLGQLVNLKSR